MEFVPLVCDCKQQSPIFKIDVCPVIPNKSGNLAINSNGRKSLDSQGYEKKTKATNISYVPVSDSEKWAYSRDRSIASEIQ
jgi:hypothetical protein